MSHDHPAIRERLERLMGELGGEIPQTMGAFGALHDASTAGGALTKATKELIALAIAIAVHCDGCIAYHVHDAVEAGATRQEVLETIGVAIMMGGGPSIVYGSEAYAALGEFEAAA